MPDHANLNTANLDLDLERDTLFYFLHCVLKRLKDEECEGWLDCMNEYS